MGPSVQASSDGVSPSAQAEDALSPSSSMSLPSGIAMDRPPEVALVAVSGSADFEAVRGWCDTVSRVCCLQCF